MANLRIDLTKFKAAGVYTIEFDASENLILPVQTLRLVVGFSKKGPFNTLVYLPDIKTSRKIFGEVDTMLERRGSFFHRSLESCLLVGPVFAINLLPLNNVPVTSGGDAVDYMSYSLSTTEENGFKKKYLYSGFYNKERFWFPDTEYLNAIANADAQNEGKLFNLVNLEKKEISFLIRKAKVKGFDVSAKTWFGAGKVPAYIAENDYISEYFIEIIALEGNWSNYATLSVDPVFSRYFNSNGVVKATLDEFISSPEVNLVARFVGTIIPGLVDGNGINYFIENIVNSRVATTGIFCAINTDYFDDYENSNSKVDLVGHNLIGTNNNSMSFLSYSTSIKSDLTYTDKNAFTSTNILATGITVSDAGGKFNNKLTIPSTHGSYAALVANVVVGQTLVAGSILSGPTATWLTVKQKAVIGTNLELVIDHPAKSAETSASLVDPSVISSNYHFVYDRDIFEIQNVLSFDVFVGYPESQAFIDFKAGVLTSGDKMYDGTTDYFISGEFSTDSAGIEIITIKAYQESELLNQIDVPALGTTLLSDLVTSVGSTETNVISLKGNLNERIPFTSIDGTNSNIVMTIANGQKISIKDYLVAKIVNPDLTITYRLTKIAEIKKVFNTTSNLFEYHIKSAEPVATYSSNTEIERFSPIEDFVDSYRFFNMSGFKLTAWHLPGDASNFKTQLEKIVTVLDPASGNLFNTLASNELVQFRYIVDTFDGGLAPSSYPKNILSKLAMTKQKCLAFINAPSIAKFKLSNDPRFTDEPDPTNGNPTPLIRSEYIADGGNLDIGPSFRYSLPTEEEGSKYCGVFLPFLTIFENGRNWNIPPAAAVSNLFIKKFLDGNPYAAAAGPKRGLIRETNLVGLEYNFLLSDREFFEPVGLNTIISDAKKGIMLYGNETSYQTVSSALNSLHVRDLLISIEDGTETILKEYLYSFNDSPTRLEVKSLVESYLEGVQTDGGIDAFSVQIDETNNTPELIGQDFGFIDIIVEPKRVFRKFINRITITKPGGVSSGGFTNV